MNRLFFAGVLLTLCGSSFAQAWSPLPVFQSTMGESWTSLFGAYAAGRYQILDGNFRDKPLVVTKLSVRVDEEKDYNATNGTGRLWNDVILDASPTDFDKVTVRFSTNHMSTPTRCFRGPVVWPTIRGVQKNPLSNFPIQLPFTTPFINLGNGRNDMLFDFRMSGGVLANNDPAWKGNAMARYVTDTYAIKIYKVGKTRTWHDAAAGGCFDSNGPNGVPHARATQFLSRYSPAYVTNPNLQNMVRIYSTTHHVAPNAPYLNVVDFDVNDAGIPFGAGCEKLFLRLTPYAMFFPFRADALGNGPANLFGFPAGFVRAKPGWGGIEVFTQSVWNDSRTNAVKLSSASSAKVPVFLILRDRDAKRGVVFHWTHGPYGLYNVYNPVNPILRYN